MALLSAPIVLSGRPRSSFRATTQFIQGDHTVHSGRPHPTCSTGGINTHEVLKVTITIVRVRRSVIRRCLPCVGYAGAESVPPKKGHSNAVTLFYLRYGFEIPRRSAPRNDASCAFTNVGSQHAFHHTRSFERRVTAC